MSIPQLHQFISQRVMFPSYSPIETSCEQSSARRSLHTKGPRAAMHHVRHGLPEAQHLVQQ